MSIMLFADDVILLSFTITGLQHQLNILNDTVNNLGLVVNLSKSNVVVFRNGGHLALGRIRITGVSHVCFTLYRYGFGFAWENQGVCVM